jgi:GcrA cell cycle regulator
MAMPTEWTDDDIALLRKLWAEGKTATAIAARLGGISRSAVLGKVFRLRLPPAVDNSSPAPIAKPSHSIARRRGSQKPLPATKPDARPKSLFELTNNCCRWPYRRPGTEKYFFCGVPEAALELGIPYCPRHMKRAYLIAPVPAPPQRKESKARQRYGSRSAA